MKIEKFQLERLLSVWQNVVDYDFTDTGVHSLYLHELISREELNELYNSVHLRYIQINGPIPLKESIIQMYPGTDIENISISSISHSIMERESSMESLTLVGFCRVE